jgi:uncharacterized membrane protein YdjX (TVP38/TMEM64 family)
MSFDFEPSAYVLDREPLWRRVVTSRGIQMIALILIVGGVGWSWATSQGGVELLRTRFGVWAAIPLMLLQASVTVTPFPDELIGFANSAIYGFGLGFTLNWVAWMLGALIEYAVARRSAYDFEFDPEQFSARMPSILRRYSAEHPLYLILARQVPFGGHIVNSWAGAFRVPLWRFLWTGALGMIPGSIAIAAAANGLISWAT